ncbi:MAG: hypothetical protein IJS86_05590 [Lachnospiraceae bacterium]|nr:hypothetical protein [Lachnospiraceae bacterium]
MNLRQYLRGLGLGIIVSTLIVSAGKSGRAAELSNDEIKARAKQLGMVDSDEMLLSKAQSLAKETEDKDRAEKEKKEKETMEPVSGNEASDEKDKDEPAVSENEVSGNRTSVSSEKTGKASSADEGMIEGSFLGAGAGSSDPKDAVKTQNTQKDSSGAKASGNDVSAAKPSEDGEERRQTVTVAELESRNSDAGRAAGNGEKVEEARPADEGSVKPAAKPVSVTIVKGESSTAVAKKLQNAGVINDAAQFDSYLCLNGFDRKLVTGAHSIPAGASAREVAEIITGR